MEWQLHHLWHVGECTASHLHSLLLGPGFSRDDEKAPRVWLKLARQFECLVYGPAGEDAAMRTSEAMP